MTLNGHYENILQDAAALRVPLDVLINMHDRMMNRLFEHILDSAQAMRGLATSPANPTGENSQLRTALQLSLTLLLTEEEREDLAGSQKISAVKSLRVRLGLSLKDAVTLANAFNMVART